MHIRSIVILLRFTTLLVRKVLSLRSDRWYLEKPGIDILSVLPTHVTEFVKVLKVQFMFQPYSCQIQLYNKRAFGVMNTNNPQLKGSI